jgi:hypothetical protein
MAVQIMNKDSEQTIQTFGARSSLMVIGLASFFAIFGAAASFASSFTGFTFLLAFPWIPLCFLVIPPVHYLCRELVRLQNRVKELESKLEHKQ